jgi:hypothetical protein
MHRVFETLLLASLALPAAAFGKGAISISLSPSVITLQSHEAITLDITVTNNSSTPKYLDRNVLQPLEYAVKNDACHVQCAFADPPPPTPNPDGEEDWIWIRPNQTIQFSQRLSQDDLCIKAPGIFHVYAFLQGRIATEAQRKHDELDWFFTDSQPITVVIRGK